MSDLVQSVFEPREGAVLDLESLRVLAWAPSQMLSTWLAARRPGANALIIEGLDLQGEPAPAGPPGSVRPDAMVDGATVSPGRALVAGRDGRPHAIEIKEPVRVAWPDSSGARVRGALVLFVAETADTLDGGLAVSRKSLTVRLGFVRPESADQPHLLPIAAAVGNGQDWATDICRVLQPEHATIRAVLKRFERLEHSVWTAEPEGSVWDRQVLGRSWVRYQTVAASVLQAARLQLATHAMTTQERVRLFVELRIQLERSVERTATELLQLIGSVEGAGPYREVAGID